MDEARKLSEECGKKQKEVNGFRFHPDNRWCAPEKTRWVTEDIQHRLQCIQLPLDKTGREGKGRKTSWVKEVLLAGRRKRCLRIKASPTSLGNEIATDEASKGEEERVVCCMMMMMMREDVQRLCLWRTTETCIDPSIAKSHWGEESLANGGKVSREKSDYHAWALGELR